MTHINAKATPIDDNDYNFHITSIELVYSIIHITGFISCHQPQERTHTHTHTTHTHTQTHNTHMLQTKSISRNQVHGNLWLAHTQFKNIRRLVPLHSRLVPLLVRQNINYWQINIWDMGDKPPKFSTAKKLCYAVHFMSASTVKQLKEQQIKHTFSSY